MTLLLMRHGKSDWSGDAPDLDRPVSDRGKRDAQRVGHYLGREELVPELVVTSPAKRARETAEKCIKAAGGTVERIVQDKRLYEAAPYALDAVIEDYQDRAERVMFVGHNPGFDSLLASLVDDSLPYDKRGRLMTTASLAVIEGRQLARFVRPKSLPEKFEFERDGRPVAWDRPPYYYKQSGVLPFRIRHGQLEVLLISKSGKGKWGIPKGIVEPGMTAADSAAKECEEEAGVLGVVGTSPLDVFEARKWGGVTRVQVFPLEVTDVFEDWEEAHKRDRRWFAAAEAQAALRQKAVRPMIDGLLARYMKVLE